MTITRPLIAALLALLFGTMVRAVNAAPVAHAADEAAAPIYEARGHLAAGWPQQVVGSVTGTPGVADFKGDGKLAVIAPSLENGWFKVDETGHNALADPQLFAFHFDGTPVAGWPIDLLDPPHKTHTDDPNGVWFSAPSVLDLDGDGCDDVVMPLPEGSYGVKIICGDLQPWPLPPIAPITSCCSMPLVDIDGDGIIDLIAGQVLTNVVAQPIKNWPDYRMPHGYAPCIGDANGDGKLEIYQPNWETPWQIPDQPPAHTISAYDNTGHPLAGWPQKIAIATLYPVMGDVTGDDKMEICTIDLKGNLHLWTWDGQPLPSTHPTGELTSVFKEAGTDPDTQWSYTVTLADLDGDGKAEILAASQARNLHAWHGDGTPVRGEDGLIAHVPRLVPNSEAAVADLGGDGIADIFYGSLWIRLGRDGTVTETQMLPDTDVKWADGATGTSLADLNGDGTAEAIFGTRDGRVWVYETGMTYKPAWAQWPTTRGNYQRTGCWVNPAKR